MEPDDLIEILQTNVELLIENLSEHQKQYLRPLLSMLRPYLVNADELLNFSEWLTKTKQKFSLQNVDIYLSALKKELKISNQELLNLLNEEHLKKFDEEGRKEIEVWLKWSVVAAHHINALEPEEFEHFKSLLFVRFWTNPFQYCKEAVEQIFTKDIQIHRDIAELCDKGLILVSQLANFSIQQLRAIAQHEITQAIFEQPNLKGLIFDGTWQVEELIKLKNPDIKNYIKKLGLQIALIGGNVSLQKLEALTPDIAFFLNLAHYVHFQGDVERVQKVQRLFDAIGDDECNRDALDLVLQFESNRQYLFDLSYEIDVFISRVKDPNRIALLRKILNFRHLSKIDVSIIFREYGLSESSIHRLLEINNLNLMGFILMHPGVAQVLHRMNDVALKSFAQALTFNENMMLALNNKLILDILCFDPLLIYSLSDFSKLGADIFPLLQIHQIRSALKAKKITWKTLSELTLATVLALSPSLGTRRSNMMIEFFCEHRITPQQLAMIEDNGRAELLLRSENKIVLQLFTQLEAEKFSQVNYLSEQVVKMLRIDEALREKVAHGTINCQQVTKVLVAFCAVELKYLHLLCQKYLITHKKQKRSFKNQSVLYLQKQIEKLIEKIEDSHDFNGENRRAAIHGLLRDIHSASVDVSEFKSTEVLKLIEDMVDCHSTRNIEFDWIYRSLIGRIYDILNLSLTFCHEISDSKWINKPTSEDLKSLELVEFQIQVLKDLHFVLPDMMSQNVWFAFEQLSDFIKQYESEKKPFAPVVKFYNFNRTSIYGSVKALFFNKGTVSCYQEVHNDNFQSSLGHAHRF